VNARCTRASGRFGDEGKQRADDGDEHRDERAEQERSGEERRVIDGELDLERKVHGQTCATVARARRIAMIRRSSVAVGWGPNVASASKPAPATITPTNVRP